MSETPYQAQRRTLRDLTDKQEAGQEPQSHVTPKAAARRAAEAAATKKVSKKVSKKRASK